MELFDLYQSFKFFFFYEKEKTNVDNNLDLTFNSGLPWYDSDLYYHNGVVRVNGGYKLHTKPGKETLIRSQESVKHGIISADIKLPKGQGIWSAFWLFADNGMPEYDYEWCGQEKGVHVTAHWGYTYEKGKKKSTLHNYRHHFGFHSVEWNNYSFELTPYEVIFRINGYIARKIKRGISTGQQHIIFSTGYGDYCGKGDSAGEMQIKNIKVNKVL